MSKIYPCVYCTDDGYCKKYSDEEVTSWCVQGPCKDEKPSNADRIRSLSDEELAEWIADDLIEPGYNTREQTVKMWLNWLKEEAGEQDDKL